MLTKLHTNQMEHEGGGGGGLNDSMLFLVATITTMAMYCIALITIATIRTMYSDGSDSCFNWLALVNCILDSIF